MPKLKTKDDFINDIKYYFGDEYELASDYINAKNPITIRHKRCNTEWTIQSAGKLIMRGTVCPNCGSKKSYNNEEIQDLLKKLYNNEYELISLDEKEQKAVFKHKICGNLIERSPKEFFVNKKICPDCKVNRNKISIDDMNQYIKENANGEYTILSEDIINVDTHIKIRHDVCGHEYNVAPQHFRKGKRCPYCDTLRKRLSVEEVSEKIKEASKGEYTFNFSEYTSVQSMIKFKHLKCGHKFNMRLADFLYHDQRCPYCNESKGERKIEEILKKLNIKYKRQFKFKKKRCFYKDDLIFDFVIKIPSTNQTALIEYNGVQHYREVKFFGGEENFNVQQMRDKIKKDYCIKNKKPLLIIKYNQYKDIEKLITNFIERHSDKK